MQRIRVTWAIVGALLLGLVAVFVSSSRARTPAAPQSTDGRTFVFVRVPEALQPLERGTKYEDPLHEALQRGGHGEVTGGGSSLSDPDANGKRHIEWVGLDIELRDLERGLPVLKSELVRLDAPRGTVLEYERGGVAVEEPLIGALVPAKDYPDAGRPVVKEPDANELAWLVEQRAVASTLISRVCGSLALSTADEKLRAIQAVLDSGKVRADQTAELQSLGILLGDVFVSKHGWRWVTAVDRMGHDPALRAPATEDLAFPRTMISKRVESGEKFDVAALCDGIAASISAKASGR